jgi:hypothetical protein
MTIPSIIIIGDTATWTHSDPAYPATDGWVLDYTLINAANKYTVTATAAGVDYAAIITAEQSAAMQAGQYKWLARVSRTVTVLEAHTVGEGVVTLQDNFAALETLDVRSHAVKTLAAIEATLEGRATSATSEYQIAGRAMKYIPIPELLMLRDKYKREVAGETAAAGLAAGFLPAKGRIYVRMGR